MFRLPSLKEGTYSHSLKASTDFAFDISRKNPIWPSFSEGRFLIRLYFSEQEPYIRLKNKLSLSFYDRSRKYLFHFRGILLLSGVSVEKIPFSFWWHNLPSGFDFWEMCLFLFRNIFLLSFFECYCRSLFTKTFFFLCWKRGSCVFTNTSEQIFKCRTLSHKIKRLAIRCNLQCSLPLIYLSHLHLHLSHADIQALRLVLPNQASRFMMQTWVRRRYTTIHCCCLFGLCDTRFTKSSVSLHTADCSVNHGGRSTRCHLFGPFDAKAMWRF